MELKLSLGGSKRMPADRTVPTTLASSDHGQLNIVRPSSRAWPMFAAAAAMPVAMLLLLLVLRPYLADAFVPVLFLIPIALSAFLGGLWPGLLALAVASALSIVVLPAESRLAWPAAALVGALVCLLADFHRRARRRAEAETLAIGDRLARLIELAPVGVSIVQDGTIVFVNSTGARIAGAASPDEVIGRQLSEFYHPVDAATNAEQMASALEHGREISVVRGRARQLDGSIIEIDAWSGPCTFNGAPAMQSITRDVTEQHLATAFLARQNAVLERVATGAPLTEVLDEIVAMVEDQVPGVLCSILLLDGRDRLRVASARSLPAAYNAAVDGVEIGPCVGSCGTAAFRREAVIVADIASDPLWANYRDLALGHGLRACWSEPIFETPRVGEHGKVLGTFAVYAQQPCFPDRLYAQLIVRAEQLARIAIESDRTVRELRDSEERFRTFVDHASDALFLHRAGGEILDVNRQACESLGYAREDLIGQNPGFLDPDITPARLEQLVQELSAGKTIAFDSRHQRKDGTLFPVEVRIRPFTLAGNRFGLALVRDISERRQAEAALRQSEAKFRQSQKMEAVGRLAGGVAHDFNNLLTVITGHCSLLLEGMHPERGREAILEIRAAGERAAQLTHQLLAFSRKALVEPVVLDLNQLVSESEKLLRRLIGEDILLATLLCPVPCKIKADPGQLEQVVMNLAINARDAMQDGGRLTLETSILDLEAADLLGAADLKPGRHVQLTVTDTGCGMPDEIKPNIFEPFFTTKEVGKGTGLGLAMVHGVVKQSGGHVEVDSKVGIGTSFRLLFPEVSGPTAVPAATLVREPSGGREIVLLVEDEHTVRKIARIALETQGYTVLEASCSAEALQLSGACARPIDLLVTDVVMPEMGGRQLAEAIRSQRPGLRVLFMSGYTNDAVIRFGAIAPSDAFFKKPFTPRQLAAAVRSILDGSA
jgi:PAS domain S-box-containing protein